ncbi:hypothetical protein OG225_41260 (plasmid) [Nocardia sp. NBC_01377]|uniref:hypothetical protein n=1 Tax=Nocardia sp. NBC_01377 TaxID=2903595 RepID=UPI002F908F47
MAHTAPRDRPTAAVTDLRKATITDLLADVAARLATSLDHSTIVRKRRTLGIATDRNTWVRIEARPHATATAQGQTNNGIETSALLHGIAKPRWHQAVSWLDDTTDTLWRADECDLVTGPAATPIGYPLTEPTLTPHWWTTLNTSLDNLARQSITRRATPDTQPITQALVTDTIEGVFPGALETTIDDTRAWVPAHADLVWSNLTAPDCQILDWEDLGLAPRGLDAATLWTNSLMIPALADRVFGERQADLETRSGKLMALFTCCKDLTSPGFATAPAYAPTTAHATRLIAELTH